MASARKKIAIVQPLRQVLLPPMCECESGICWKRMDYKKPASARLPENPASAETYFRLRRFYNIWQNFVKLFPWLFAGHDPQGELGKLAAVDRRWGMGHQIRSLLSLGEGNHVPNAFGPGQYHH